MFRARCSTQWEIKSSAPGYLGFLTAKLPDSVRTALPPTFSAIAITIPYRPSIQRQQYFFLNCAMPQINWDGKRGQTRVRGR
jgi:hypothetical protein